MKFELVSIPKPGVRHWQCFWYSLLILGAYITRIMLSFLIVPMTDPSTRPNHNIPTYPEWTHKGTILSAFFWGYTCPQIFAGYAAKRFGGKWILVITLSIQALLTILIPVTADRFGESGIIVSRAAAGLFQGFLFPTLSHLLSQWTPQEERSRMISITFAAPLMGTVIGFLSSGLIASSKYGWPMMFYLYGAVTLFLCVCFSLKGYDRPADHPHITEAEKLYITKGSLVVDEKSHYSIPWKSIFMSVPIWALFFAKNGAILGFYVLLNGIPSYMNYVMNLNVKDNGLLTCLPYLLAFIATIAFSFVSDKLVNDGSMSRTKARKMFTTFGFILPALALLVLAFTNPGQIKLAVILLVIANGSHAFSEVGCNINHVDLAPNHAGAIMGILNGVGSILGIWAPLMVQMLVNDEKDPLQWRQLFIITAGTYIGTAIIFVLFGSAETQAWNNEGDVPPEEGDAIDK